MRKITKRGWLGVMHVICLLVIVKQLSLLRPYLQETLAFLHLLFSALRLFATKDFADAVAEQ